LFALCHHLVLQGYSAQDIVILTTYPSQWHYLQKVSTACCLPVEGRTAEVIILTVMLINQPTNQPSTKQLHGIVLEKITVPQLVNKFCIFCRTQRFITACPCPEPDESRPSCPILPCKIHINIILPSAFVS